MSFFGLGKGEGMREKLTSAVREVELRRRGLQNLKSRLEERKKNLFEVAVRATKERDETKARVYANEYSELVKALRVVTKAEIALIQTVMRIESIRDFGDILHEVSSAFKVMRKVSRTFSPFLPTVEDVSEEVCSTISKTLVELGRISPEFSIDLGADDPNEILAKARAYAEKREEEVKEIAEPIITFNRASQGRVTLLAAGEDQPEQDGDDHEAFNPIVFSRTVRDPVDESVRSYLEDNRDDLDILRASAELGLPVDEVEESIVRLASQGKVVPLEGSVIER